MTFSETPTHRKSGVEKQNFRTKTQMEYLSPEYFFIVFLRFIATITTNSASPMQPSCPDYERSALLQFKQSFHIDCAFASSDPSAYPKVESWVSRSHENCCSWDGVACDKETGHVVVLDLSSSCLNGSFPSNNSLFSLTHLKHLNLADNFFNASLIPSEMGKFSKLQSLNLSMSAFTGQIPSEISKLSGLSLLDLSWNGASSSSDVVLLKLEDPNMDRLVRNLTRLKHLLLDSVDIFSSVPIILTNLTSLQTLSLSFSELHGEFPRSIFSLQHLEVLCLDGNEDLTGFLPDQFQHSSALTLRELSLSSTSFSGQLPPSIGKLAHLEKFTIDSCQFLGPIPSSFGNLTRLTYLNLNNNSFSSGVLPYSLTDLTQFRSLTALAYLDLGNNHLTGQIPDWLMNLTQLEFLSLEDNQLVGQIPQGISQLVNLKQLMLNNNNDLRANFSTFLKLKSLKFLHLSGVNLTFPTTNMVANDSVAKFISLDLSNCNLTVFPHFLHTQGELEDLILRNNEIHDLIPQWFINITRESLYMLEISSNFLTGFEQPVVVLPWTRLEVLNLELNKLQGSLPIPGNSMVLYQVAANLFKGGIPRQLCHATSLQYLDLSNNSLGGEIPKCISRLADSLSIMNLRGNNFHGTIPGGYSKSCKLTMINLSQNQLEGNLPRSLTNCSMLQDLDIGENNVNDTFPSWLGSLPKLEMLVLRRNKFYGSIGKPKSTLDFQSLRIIDLSTNFYTGEIPYHYFPNSAAMKIIEENQQGVSHVSFSVYIKTLHATFVRNYRYNNQITITNKGNQMLFTNVLTVYCVIDFSSNNFTGSIPSSIGELKGLQALNLSNNIFNGDIPTSLANMRDLESLDLSNNMLSGQIPHKLTQLTYLEVFNVSNNFLKGLVPQGNQFNAFDNSSFAGNMGLCGSPLSKKCEVVNGAQLPMMSMDNKDDDSNLIDWVIRSSGFISGFFVCGAAGKYITDQNHEWFMETFGRKRRP